MERAEVDGTAAGRAIIASRDARYQLYLATSLTLALAVGFVLAIALSLAMSLERSWGLRWQALAQVHGHVQFIGFAGFFVVGMAYRLMPRFSGAPLRHAWTVMPVYALLLAGLLLRTITQPLNDHQAFAWGLIVASVCEAVSGALFCLSMLATLARPLRERRPWAPFVAAGAAWLAIQALLGAWFLTDLALHGSALNGFPAGRTVLPAARDSLLLTIQLYGFLLGFVLGVSSRTVPVFFAHRPPTSLLLAACGFLQLGIVLVAGATATEAPLTAGAVWAEAAGLFCLGAGLIGAAGSSGCWKPASRLRTSARGVVAILRTAYGCCALAGVLNVVFALRDLAAGELLPGNDADAIRHLLALGVVTMLIVGMAHLVVPVLARQRQAGVTGRVRLRVLGVLLSAAVSLRVLPPLLTSLTAQLKFSLLGSAGVLAWLAIALFTWALWSARTAPPPVESL